MADAGIPHGYTYPNTSDDPDQRDVLRNRFGLKKHSDLQEAEYRVTNDRRIDIALGLGPSGNFDAAHLKALHKHLFCDIYEWAGHTRNERPVVDGKPVEPIGILRKDRTTFLPGSRMEMGLAEALRPIRDPEVLRNATAKRFAAVAGHVLNELNYVHPFREGNGRTQEIFISELGRRYEHDVRFSVITRPRMIAASVAGATNPASTAMQHLLEDAVDPARSAALAETFAELRRRGMEPLSCDIRTARPGETLSGTLSGVTPSSSWLDTSHGLVVIPAHEVASRNLTLGDPATVTVTSDFQPPASHVGGFSRLASALSARHQPHTAPSSPEWLERSAAPKHDHRTGSTPAPDQPPSPPRPRPPSPGR